MQHDHITMLYSASRAYLDGAHLLVSNHAAHGRDYLVLPSHALIGLAIETAYKTILAHKGVPESDLRARALGHDIIALRDRAADEGFKTSTRIEEVVDHIGHDYANHLYRYPKPNSQLNKVDERAAIAALDSFIDEVAREVGIPSRPSAPT